MNKVISTAGCHDTTIIRHDDRVFVLGDKGSCNVR